MDKFVLPIEQTSKLNDGKMNKNEYEKKEEQLKNSNFDLYLDESLQKIKEEEKQIRQKQKEGDKQFLEKIRQQIMTKQNKDTINIIK